MPMIMVYVDDQTEKRLREAAEETQRSVEDLAEAAVAEAALAWWKDQQR